MDVRDTVLDDFKRLVREQGMSDDTIIIKQNKGTAHGNDALQIAVSPANVCLNDYVPK